MTTLPATIAGLVHATDLAIGWIPLLVVVGLVVVVLTRPGGTR